MPNVRKYVSISLFAIFVLMFFTGLGFRMDGLQTGVRLLRVDTPSGSSLRENY